MSLVTVVFGVVSFGAGFCAGVYVNEKDIVNCQDIRHGGGKLIAGARVVYDYAKKELAMSRNGKTSPVPASDNA